MLTEPFARFRRISGKPTHGTSFPQPVRPTAKVLCRHTGSFGVGFHMGLLSFQAIPPAPKSTVGSYFSAIKMILKATSSSYKVSSSTNRTSRRQHQAHHLWPMQDPIIAQSPSGPMLVDPKKQPLNINHFVTTTGGEYFFSPSISTLQAIGDGSLSKK